MKTKKKHAKPTGRRYNSVDELVKAECSPEFYALFLKTRKLAQARLHRSLRRTRERMNKWTPEEREANRIRTDALLAEIRAAQEKRNKRKAASDAAKARWQHGRE